MKSSPKFPVVILFILFAYLSISCDCTKTPIEKHIKDTKFILTATVIELLDKKDEDSVNKLLPESSHKVKVKVMTSYKGGFRKGQILELGSDYSDCSFVFKPKLSYLLFLEKKDNSDKYIPVKCSYNEELDLKGSNIRKIEKQLNHKHTKS